LPASVEAKPNEGRAAKATKTATKAKKRRAAKSAPTPGAKSQTRRDERDAPAAALTASDDQSYAYEFPDDPLYAAGGGAQSAIIKVRQPAVRMTLIRPRLHFVGELLKSVEQL
jgi:hypothetical protein